MNDAGPSLCSVLTDYVESRCESCGMVTCPGDCEITDPVVLAVLREGAAFAAEVAQYTTRPEPEEVPEGACDRCNGHGVVIRAGTWDDEIECAKCGGEG